MWQLSFDHATVALSFKIEIYDLDKTKSSFQAGADISITSPRSVALVTCLNIEVAGFISKETVECKQIPEPELPSCIWAFQYSHTKNQYFAEEISIFPRGNNMTKKNKFLPHMPAADLAFFQGGASSTSRVAASRFFCYFEPP